MICLSLPDTKACSGLLKKQINLQACFTAHAQPLPVYVNDTLILSLLYLHEADIAHTLFLFILVQIANKSFQYSTSILAVFIIIYSRCTLFIPQIQLFIFCHTIAFNSWYNLFA